MHAHALMRACVVAVHGLTHAPMPTPSSLQAVLDQDLKDYVGRETPLYYAERLSKRYTKCVGGGGEVGADTGPRQLQGCSAYSGEGRAAAFIRQGTEHTHSPLRSPGRTARTPTST